MVGPVAGKAREGFGAAYQRLTKCFRQNRRSSAHKLGKRLRTAKESQPGSREEAKPHRVVKDLVGNFSGPEKFLPTRRNSGSCLGALAPELAAGKTDTQACHEW